MAAENILPEGDAAYLKSLADRLRAEGKGGKRAGDEGGDEGSEGWLEFPSFGFGKNGAEEEVDFDEDLRRAAEADVEEASAEIAQISREIRLRVSEILFAADENCGDGDCDERE